MTHFNTKLLQCARSHEADIHLILLYFCISLRSIRAICESVCCLDSTQLIVIWTPAIGWVHPLYSSSSQPAEQSAESSHMSDFGLRFFFLFLPSTCQDTRRRRRDQNKPADWFAASHQLVFSKRAVLLKGQSPFIVVIIMLLLLLFISTNHATKEKKNN